MLHTFQRALCHTLQKLACPLVRPHQQLQAHEGQPQRLPNEIIALIIFFLLPTAKRRLRAVSVLFNSIATRDRFERVYISFLADAGSTPLELLRAVRQHVFTSPIHTLLLLAARMRESSIVHRDERSVLSSEAKSMLSQELIRSLPAFRSLYQLDLEWGYGSAAEFTPTLSTVWEALGPQLRVLRLKLAAANISHFLHLPTVAIQLEELILAIENRETDEWGETSGIGNLVDVLVMPARDSLRKLDVSFRMAPRWGRKGQNMHAGAFFEAMEHTHFPRLATIAIRTPFRGEESGHEEQALVRFLNMQAAGGALANLSITPGSTFGGQFYGQEYTAFLSQMASSAPTWFGLRKLSLAIPPTEAHDTGFNSILHFLQSLRSSLAQVSLNGLFLDANQVLRVVRALSAHAHSLEALRLLMTSLTPSTCDLFAGQFRVLDTLEIVIDRVCGSKGDEQNPPKSPSTMVEGPDPDLLDDQGMIDAFTEEMGVCRYPAWPLRHLAIQQTYSGSVKDDAHRVHHIAALRVLERSIPSLVVVDTSRSLGWDWPSAAE